MRNMFFIPPPQKNIGAPKRLSGCVSKTVADNSSKKRDFGGSMLINVIAPFLSPKTQSILVEICLAKYLTHNTWDRGWLQRQPTGNHILRVQWSRFVTIAMVTSPKRSRLWPPNVWGSIGPYPCHSRARNTGLWLCTKRFGSIYSRLRRSKINTFRPYVYHLRNIRPANLLYTHREKKHSMRPHDARLHCRLMSLFYRTPANTRINFILPETKKSLNLMTAAKNDQDER